MVFFYDVMNNIYKYLLNIPTFINQSKVLSDIYGRQVIHKVSKFT